MTVLKVLEGQVKTGLGVGLNHAEGAELLEYIKQLKDLANTVAHVGVDFGYGEFQLEAQHIEQARKLVPQK